MNPPAMMTLLAMWIGFRCESPLKPIKAIRQCPEDVRLVLFPEAEEGDSQEQAETNPHRRRKGLLSGLGSDAVFTSIVPFSSFRSFERRDDTAQPLVRFLDDWVEGGVSDQREHRAGICDRHRDSIYLDEGFAKAKEEKRIHNMSDLIDVTIECATMRVRPLLMTVGMNIVGLIPVMFDTGIGSDIAKRIAAPLWGGLISLTILVLLVIPAIYVIWRGFQIRHLTSASTTSISV